LEFRLLFVGRCGWALFTERVQMRTIGAKDRKQRKKRSDKGKRRPKYRGKKTKTRRQVKFDKRKGSKTHIKLWWWKREKMSLEGRRKWNKNIRGSVHPYITRFGIVVWTPVADITTREDIEEWALATIGLEGNFIVMGISASLRSRYRRKWVKMFQVVIRDSPDGLRAKFVRSFRLHRYWFFKDKR
jgi:hypothetical protein